MIVETYILWIVGLIGVFVGSIISFIGFMIILNKFTKSGEGETK